MESAYLPEGKPQAGAAACLSSSKCVNIIHNKSKASRLMSLGALFLFLPVWEQHGVYIGVVKVRPAGQLQVLGVPGDLGQAGPGPVL